MARTTPGTGIPVPESLDPRTITADLWASFSKVGQLLTQTSGESSAALVTAEQAETAAAQALARALLIEDPIHVGPSEPTGGEELWVDTDEDAPPTPVSVSSEDITDATDVGRAVLTAPLSVNARNALSIFTGTRALLDAGTDEAERTWDAKELHEYVTDTAAAAGGAASWDDLTGKPETFPPSAHTHDQADVTGLTEAIYDTGWRDVSAEMRLSATGFLHIRRIGLVVHWRIKDLDNATGHAFYWPPEGFIAPQEENTYPIQSSDFASKFYLDTTGRICRTHTATPIPAGWWWTGQHVLPADTPIPATLPGLPVT